MILEFIMNSLIRYIIEYHELEIKKNNYINNKQCTFNNSKTQIFSQGKIIQKWIFFFKNIIANHNNDKYNPRHKHKSTSTETEIEIQLSLDYKLKKNHWNITVNVSINITRTKIEIK